MKAKKRNNPEPIPKGIVIRTGSDGLEMKPIEVIKPRKRPTKKERERIEKALADDRESHRSHHTVIVKQPSKPQRNIGGLCFDEYGSGLPGQDRKVPLFMALMSQAKKDQLGSKD